MVDEEWLMEKKMGKINRVEEMPVYQLFYKLALEVE